MRFDVRDRGFKVAEGIKKYAGRRLMSGLDHRVPRTDNVTMTGERGQVRACPVEFASRRRLTGIRGATQPMVRR